MSPRQMLHGWAGSSGLGPPPPSLGSRKESSLIGSLAVSFTLNVKVKQKSQASLCCWQRRGKPSPAGPGPLVLPERELPSLTPPCRLSGSGPRLQAASNTKTQVSWGPSGSPSAGPARAHAPSAPPARHTAKHTSKCRGGEYTPAPNPDLCFLPNTVL